MFSLTLPRVFSLQQLHLHEKGREKEEKNERVEGCTRCGGGGGVKVAGGCRVRCV